MKTRRLLILGIFPWVVALSLQAGPGNGGTLASGSGGQGAESSGSDDFTSWSVPVNLVNIPAVGDPLIMDPNNLIGQNGGAAVSDMAHTAIGDMLQLSGRFALTDADSTNTTTNSYDCQCRIQLTDFKIQMWSLMRLPGVTAMTNFSFCLTHVSCGVSMRIYNLHFRSPRCVAIGEGHVNQTSTLGNILDVPSLMGTNGTSAGVTNALGVTIIQKASYRALTNMLPHLDAYLIAHQNSWYTN